MLPNSMRGYLMSGSVWVMVGRIGSVLAGLTASILLTRLLSGPEMGGYLLLASGVAAGAVFAQIGMNQAVVPLVAASQALGRPGRAAAVVRAACRCGLCGAGAAALLLLAACRLLPVHPRPSLEAAALAGLWLVALAVQNLSAESCRGLHRIREATLHGGLLANLLLLAGLAGLWAAHRHTGLVPVLGAAAVSTGIGAALGTWALQGLLRPLRAAEGVEAVGRKELFGTAIPLWVTQVALLALANADLWALGVFRPARDVAVYGVAARAAALVAAPLQVTNAVVTPLIARLYAAGQADVLARALRRVASLGTVFALGGLLVCAFWGGPLLGRVFGEGYRAGWPVLAILAVAQAVNVFAGACGLTLMMTGYQTTMMAITLLCGLATVAGVLLVVRPFGVVGVAVVSACGLVVQNLWMLAAARSKTGIWTCAGTFPVARRQITPGTNL